ncbi:MULTISPECIES: hypothetical protein [unclassified Streptomyces]|uniref:hypothetical protein n=1 Tax=unclassified Streptomyces TaxID=2593676 RepID=UPI00081EC5B7|nr:MULTISPECIES: hypothetical protein [unclassified Streptomyces]MYZ38126.1 hypothetical protein [Streptomyces sp. SID4917]SCF96482.1 hypothetical protein GA0115259_105839 [Streptomyces sp. MnatMP-M17]
MTRPVTGLLYGAAAGAAGTTALNTVGYLDMAWRARPASGTPRATVEKLSQAMHLTIPGDGAEKETRVAGLAPLTGIAAGIGLGALLGLVRAKGWRPTRLIAYATAGFGARLGTDAPMTVLKVTDPRTWSAKDRIADIVPHMAYGVVTAAVLERLDP